MADSPAGERSFQPSEPSEGERRPRRRRRRRRSSPRRQGVRLSLLYFTIASLWGFIIGTAALLGGLAAVGRPLELSATVALVLVAAALVAVIGGFVAANAYRQASERGRQG